MTSNIKRILKANRNFEKAARKLSKARAERIWVEKNKHIHLFNYPYYKLKRKLFKK